MKRLVLSILTVLAIVTAVAGCESGHKTTVIPIPEPTVAPTDTPAPTLEPTSTPISTPTPAPTSTFTPIPTSTLAPTSSATELEGTWTVTGAVPAGMLTVSGGDYTLTLPCGLQESGTLTVDTTANPKTIDLYIVASPTASETVGQTKLGIYELSGTSLRMEMAAPEDARPSSLTENSLSLIKQPSSSDTELQGVWAGEGNEITFSGSSYTFLSADGIQRSGIFSFNLAANPRTIDLCVVTSTGTSDPLYGKAVPGLYQLNDTNLTLVLGEPDAARPASLTDGTVFNLVKQ